ncbi:DUF3618 domain-containing protein [Devosia sp. CAU 1758]
MSYETEHKSSADLQREIDAQRSRVEDTIDQIQDKLSPGQLVDELLNYTKGGGEIVSNLQRQVTSNPLPVALLGVSLAWLMAKPANGAASNHDTDKAWDRRINRNRGYENSDLDEEEYGDYPVTIITGTSMRHAGHSTDEHGRSFANFTDDAGKKFRALSDENGKRAGHFIDEAGNRFKGFTNAAGERIEHFRDDAGNKMDEASGWASHTWQKTRDKLQEVSDGARAKADAGRNSAARTASAMQDQVGNLNQMILAQFRDQPLVGGGLAFALGAALGSSLPHTAQEDALVGKQSDTLKRKAADEAAHLYDEGKEKAGEVYADASERAGTAYEKAKSSLSDAVDKAPTGGKDDSASHA